MYKRQIGAGASAHYQGISVGYESKASGIGSIATGVGSTAVGLSAIATGSNATSSGIASIAVGDKSKATAGYAVAIGDKASATHGSSVALGNASETKQAAPVNDATVNGISYNGFAGTDATGTVSVGSVGNEQFTRQIVNVGAGEISSTSKMCIRDRRCAASERTIPANSTALDIMINTVGNKIPNARKIGEMCIRDRPRSNRILAPINLASRSPNESTLIRQRIRNKPRVVSKMIGERISKLS